MKFLFSAQINQSRISVVDMFCNQNNTQHWQHELLSTENLSGTPGEVGAVTKRVYKTVTIVETIVSKTLPNEIVGFYDHQARNKTVMAHKTSYRFTELSENQCLFEMEMLEVSFVGFLPKLMSKLMGGMFEKYHQKEVDQFKTFCESHA